MRFFAPNNLGIGLVAGLVIDVIEARTEREKEQVGLLVAKAVVEQKLGRRRFGGCSILANEDCVFFLFLFGDKVVHVQLLAMSDMHQRYRDDDLTLLQSLGSERTLAGIRNGRRTRHQIVNTPPIGL